MTTWQAPTDSGQFARTRQLTAAFEYGNRFAGTADVETLVIQFLATAQPETFLHRTALRLAVTRGYNTRNGVAS